MTTVSTVRGDDNDWAPSTSGLKFNGGGGSSSGGGGNNGPSEYQKQMQERQEKQAAAYRMNESGNYYFNRGDWLAAASFYQAALQQTPWDQTIQANFRNAVNNAVNAEAQRKRDVADQLKETIATRQGNPGPGTGQRAVDQAYTNYKLTNVLLPKDQLKPVDPELLKAESGVVFDDPVTVFDSNIPAFSKGNYSGPSVEAASPPESQWPEEIKKSPEYRQLQQQREETRKLDQDVDRIKAKIADAEKNNDPKMKGELQVQLVEAKTKSFQAEYDEQLTTKKVHMLFDASQKKSNGPAPDRSNQSPQNKPSSEGNQQ